MRTSNRDQATTGDELLKLAERVERLTVSRRDPNRFFEERSEIAEDLRKLFRRAQQTHHP